MGGKSLLTVSIWWLAAAVGMYLDLGVARLESTTTTTSGPEGP